MPKIEVQLVGDDRSLTRMWEHAGRGARTFDRNVGRASRGALAATLSVRGLGRALAFSSAGFLGGAGLGFALKDTIQKAEESQRVLGQTEVAVTRSGRSWKQWGREIREAALEQSKISGFDDEKILGSFNVFIRRTGDVRKALHLTALAQDVARGLNIDLASSTQLVTKASLGNAGALRRRGLAVAKDATALQLQDFLQRKFAGSAERYGRTAAGAQDRFRIALSNTQELLGSDAIPKITELLNRGADWLEQSKNQQRIQRDLSEAVHTGSAVIRDTGKVIGVVNKATGGWKNTIELVLALKVASTVASWIGPLRDLKLALFGVAAADTAVATAASAAAGAQGAAALTGAVGVGGPGQAFARRRSSRLLVPIAAEGATAAVGASAVASLTKVGKLRAALAGLSRLRVGPIAIPLIANIEIQKHRSGIAEAIGDTVKGATGSSALGGLFEKFERNIGLAMPGTIPFVTDPTNSLIPPFRHKQEDEKLKGAGDFLATIIKQAKEVSRKAKELDAAFDTPPGGKTREERIKQQRQWFDALVDRRLFRLQDLPPSGQVDALNKVAALIRAQTAKTKDVTRLADLRDKLIEIARQRKAEREQAAADFLDSLQLGLERAQATRGFGDDLDAIAKLQAGIRAQIREFGSTTDLQRQLFEAQQQFKDLRLAQLDNLRSVLQLRLEEAQATPRLGDDIKAILALQAFTRREIRETGKTVELQRDLFEVQQQLKEARKNARDARQFRELGLDAEGNERIPGIKRLKAQFDAIKKAISGTSLDTGKERAELRKIGEALADALVHGMSSRVREKVEEMLRQLNEQLRKAGVGDKFHKESTAKLVRGLGLTPEQARELRQRLARRGPGGTVASGHPSAFGIPIDDAAPARGRAVRGHGRGGGDSFVIEGDLVLTGVQNVRQLEEELRRRRRHTSAGQRRGRTGRS